MKVYVGCEGGVVPVNKQVQAQVMDIGGWWTTLWSRLPCPGLYTTNDYTIRELNAGSVVTAAAAADNNKKRSKVIPT